MDKTDMMLSMLLLADSRLTYRDLADKLGLSVNAVHKRNYLGIVQSDVCPKWQDIAKLGLHEGRLKYTGYW